MVARRCQNRILYCTGDKKQATSDAAQHDADADAVLAGLLALIGQTLSE